MSKGAGLEAGRLGGIFAALAGVVILLWLLAGPALAQERDASAQAGDAKARAGGVNVQYVDCSQVANIIAGQVQNGDANASARGQYSEAVAEIANELDISVEQVNACLGNAGKDGDTNGGKVKNDSASNGQYGDECDDVDNSKCADKSTIPAGKKILPNTGGLPLVGVAGLALALLGVGVSVIRSRR